MHKVISIVLIIFNPLVLVLTACVDLYTFIPEELAWLRLVVRAVQYLVVLAYLYLLSGLILQLRRSPPASLSIPAVNVRVDQGQVSLIRADQDEEEEEPLMVLGHQLRRMRSTDPVTDGSPVWMNTLITTVWVKLISTMENVVESLWPEVRKKVRKLPVGVDLLLDTFCLGREAPKVQRIKVQHEKEDDDKLIVDVDLFWNSSSSVNVLVCLDFYPFGSIPVSLEHIHVKVEARIVLSGLAGTVPPMDVVEFSLRELPDLYWDLGGAAKVANIPIIEKEIKKLINEQITKFMLLPNKLLIPLNSDNTTELSSPDPRGYVKLSVEKCRGLPPRGSWLQRKLGRKSTSVQVALGGEVFSSELQGNDASELTFNLNCEIPVENPEGRILHLGLFEDEERLCFREVDLSKVVSSQKDTALQWRGLCGQASDVLMSTSWCPVWEVGEEEGDDSLKSGVLSFIVVSVTSPEEIVPTIRLSLPDQAGVQSRTSWESNSLPSSNKAKEFGVGCPQSEKNVFDMAMRGGGMMRFTEGQEEQLEVDLVDKLTGETWFQVISLSELKTRRGESPLDITLLKDGANQEREAVTIKLKFKFFCDK